MQLSEQSLRVTVTAKIKAKPGKEQAVRQELTNLLRPTRAEQGCINYDLHISSTDPTLFIFHENWESEADLARHLQSPHIKSWQQRTPDLLAAPVELERWTRIE